jgi:hypothetical protein
MLKTFFTIAFISAVIICFSQVKIGYNPSIVNPGAVLELSNNTAAAPATWQSFIPPKVDFTNAAFTSAYVWGIAGAPTSGAIVYNIGESYNNGFSGPGLYCWQINSWAFINVTVADRIRMSLSTSIAAYDAAAANTWVNVTASEYNNLITVVTGAAKYAAPELFMNTATSNGWTADYTIGGNPNIAKVPASSYIIAWSVRTGIGTTSTQNSKLKVSIAQTSGYTNYGSPLPNIGTIAANTRVYFVLKAPNTTTPSAACFTAVYNATTYFLGNNTGAGSEYYVSGDSSSPNNSYPSDSYSQVISTQIRQW